MNSYFNFLLFKKEFKISEPQLELDKQRHLQLGPLHSFLFVVGFFSRQFLLDP